MSWLSPGWLRPSQATQRWALVTSVVAVRAVGARDTRLPVELTAVVGGTGTGRHVEDREVEEMADLVVLVDGQRLVVDVVEEPLHPGVAGRALSPRVFVGALVDLDGPVRIVDVPQELREVVGDGVGLLGCLAELLDFVLALLQRPLADDRGVAERPQPVRRGAVEVRQVAREGRQARRGGAQIGGQRRALDGEVVELGHRRPELCQEVVEEGEVLRQVVAAGVGDRGGVLRLLDEPDDVLAALGELADDPVRVRVEVADDRVLARQQLRDLARLLERRGAAADRLVQVVAVAGEGGAELVDQQRQALTERQAQCAQDEIVLDRLTGLGDGDVGILDPLGVAQVRDLDRIPLRGAIDEVLGDQRLRLAAADRVLPEHGDRSAQLDLDDRALARVDVERGDGARRHSRNLDLRAVGQAEGVVELDEVGVLVVAARARGEEAPDPEAHQAADDGQAPHEPGGMIEGSQSTVPPSVHGLLPSGAGRSLEPGQRL